MINPGGYQIIDCTGIKLVAGGATVTVKNASMADAFRNGKTKVITNLEFEDSGVTKKFNTIGISTTSTGSYDGQSTYFAFGVVSTNDDEVTFTPS